MDLSVCTDYRDSAPEQLSTIFKLYQPVVQEGRWTEGLCEMWWVLPLQLNKHIATPWTVTVTASLVFAYRRDTCSRCQTPGQHSACVLC
jgi:hypothetical protein